MGYQVVNQEVNVRVSRIYQASILVGRHLVRIPCPHVPHRHGIGTIVTGTMLGPGQWKWHWSWNLGGLWRNPSSRLAGMRAPSSNPGEWFLWWERSIIGGTTITEKKKSSNSQTIIDFNSDTLPWFKLFALLQKRFDRSWRQMGHGPQRQWWSHRERFPMGIASDDRNILGNSWWKVDQARMVNGGIVGATWVSPNSGHIRLLVTSAFASTTARGFSGFFVWTQQSSDRILKKQKSKEGTYRSAAVL